MPAPSQAPPSLSAERFEAENSKLQHQLTHESSGERRRAVEQLEVRIHAWRGRLSGCNNACNSKRIAASCSPDLESQSWMFIQSVHAQSLHAVAALQVISCLLAGALRHAREPR